MAREKLTEMILGELSLSRKEVSGITILCLIILVITGFNFETTIAIALIMYIGVVALHLYERFRIEE